MTIVRQINQLSHRMPEQGRIRLGTKTTSGAPKKLSTFRFTSHDQDAIREIAATYGGTAAPWADGPRAGEWEVVTQASEVPIVLPPDALSGTPIYELWSRGGCARRCDGETASTPEGDGWRETPCICQAKNALECKPKTRLLVILREVRFGGVWRLESGGWSALQELPSMVEFILGLQAGGLVAGQLGLKEESSVKGGKTRKFMVPTLAVDQSIVGVMQGLASVQALAEGNAEERPALSAPAVDHSEAPAQAFLDDGSDFDSHDDVDDAELVDEADVVAELRRDVTPAEVTFHDGVRQLIDVPELVAIAPTVTARTTMVRHAVVKLATKRRVASNTEMTVEERAKAQGLVDELLAGERRIVSFNATTETIVVSRRQS